MVVAESDLQHLHITEYHRMSANLFSSFVDKTPFLIATLKAAGDFHLSSFSSDFMLIIWSNTVKNHIFLLVLTAVVQLEQTCCHLLNSVSAPSVQ